MRVVAHEAYGLGPRICGPDLTVQAQHVAHHQLGDVRRTRRHASAARAQHRHLAETVERVKPHELLADVRVGDLARLARELDEPVRAWPTGSSEACTEHDDPVRHEASLLRRLTVPRQAVTWFCTSNVVSWGGAANPPSIPCDIFGNSTSSRNRSQLSFES